MEESQLHIHGLLREREESISKVTSFLATLDASSSIGVLEGRNGIYPTRSSKRKLAGVDAISTGLEPRRRTASFRPYKIPRALKEKRRVKKVRGEEVGFTSRCRKHRRRPHIMLRKHEALGAESRWLQTHLWHRKRMYMEKRWDTWLAVYNRGRGMARKLASVPSSGCALHDESYLVPLELRGERGHLESLLRRFIDPGEVLFASQEEEDQSGDTDYSQSPREMDVLIYHKDCFPKGRLGPVSMTILAADSHQWHVMLWLHPSNSEEIVKSIRDTAKDMAAKEAVDVASPEIGYCRFALRGAGVIDLLEHFLIGAKGSSDRTAGGESSSALLTALTACTPRAVSKVWPLNYCLGISVGSLGAHKRRVVGRPEDTPRRSRGPKPRLEWNSESAGHKYTAGFTNQQNGNAAAGPSSSVVLIRKDDSLSAGRLQDAHVIKKDQRLAGVDVLVPASMAKALWCALALQGAEVCPLGYEEMAYLRLCAGIPSFPRDYPETPAGKEYWLHRIAEEMRINALLPPRKRKVVPSYIHRKQDELSGSTTSRDYLVVREGRYLAAFEHKAGVSASPNAGTDAMEDESGSSDGDEDESDEDGEEEEEGKQGSQTAVPVLIKSVSRGVPNESAALYLPSPDDLAQFLHYAENKAVLDTSKGKRLGLWPGASAESSGGDGRLELGCVTSGVNRAPRGGRRNRGKVLFVPGHHAIALVGTDGLQKIQRNSADISAKGPNLVLFRNPGSDLMRPAFLHVIYG